MRKAGRMRKLRRIQEVLDLHGMNYGDVARRLGVSNSLVSQAVHGVNNNRRVLGLLLELGVRPSDLDLPEDMRACGENSNREVA